MTNHEEKEVTSHFSYYDLFHIYKKLNKETSKLKHFVFTSKSTTSSLEFENKNLLEEIKF